mgnify:CR=1 FL=1
MKPIKEKIIPKAVKSERDWQDFLAHRLSSEREAEFLKQGEEDEFYKEAFEGINSVANRAQVLSTINQLNAKVRQKTGGKQSESKLGQWSFEYVRIAAIAAVVVVLLGLTFLFNYISGRFGTQDIAQKEEVRATAVETVEPVINSDASVSKYVDTAFFEDPATIIASKEAEPPQKTVVENKPTPPPASAIPPVAVKTPIAEEKKAKALNSSVVSQPAATKKEEFTSIAEAYKTISAADRAEPASTAVKPAAREAMSAPSSISAGTTPNLISGQDDADIKWTKAMSFLNNNEKKKAIVLFKELLNDNTKYKDRAKAELEKLK